MVPASRFEVLVAIDLRGGRVVRLRQGDFDRETTFSDEPVETARGFVAAGVRWLHVVDLDGARSGTPAHAATVREIVAAAGSTAAVEVAGGLRTLDAVGEALMSGAARVVVGTAAIRDPGFAAELVGRWGSDSIVVAVDVRDGRAQGDGWLEAATKDEPATLIARLADVGVKTFEVTAIDRDGMLAGPDLELYRTLVDAGHGDIVASGGIASVADLAALRDAGCVGAIVGRAIFEGRLSVADALSIGSNGGAWPAVQ
jgi:phosphoribosylformimino-5-aminoimidazole carboxamide ribotide isomerase